MSLKSWFTAAFFIPYFLCFTIGTYKPKKRLLVFQMNIFRGTLRPAAWMVVFLIGSTTCQEDDFTPSDQEGVASALPVPMALASPERSMYDSGYAQTANFILNTALKLPPHVLPSIQKKAAQQPGHFSDRADTTVGVYLPADADSNDIGIYLLPEQRHKLQQHLQSQELYYPQDNSVRQVQDQPPRRRRRRKRRKGSPRPSPAPTAKSKPTRRQPRPGPAKPKKPLKKRPSSVGGKLSSLLPATGKSFLGKLFGTDKPPSPKRPRPKKRRPKKSRPAPQQAHQHQAPSPTPVIKRPINIIINKDDKPHPYPFQPADFELPWDTLDGGISQSIETSKTKSRDRYLFDASKAPNRRRHHSSPSPTPLTVRKDSFTYRPHPAAYDNYDYTDFSDYDYSSYSDDGYVYDDHEDNEYRRKGTPMYNPGSKYSKYVPAVVKQVLANAFLANPEPYLKQLELHERRKRRRRKHQQIKAGFIFKHPTLQRRNNHVMRRRRYSWRP